MSEPLAAGFLFSCAGLTVLAVHTRSPWLLPAIATAFAAAVMTRIAAAFGLLLLVAGTAAVVHARWREVRRLLAPLALVALIGASSIAVSMWHTHQRGGYYALNPMRYYEEGAIALEIADESDAQWITDPSARTIFEKAREKRLELRAKQGRSEDPIEKFELNLNIWGSLGPAILAEYCRLGNGPSVPVQNWESPAGEVNPTSLMPQLPCFTDRMLGEIANPILSRHWDKRWVITRHALGETLLKYVSVRAGSWSFPWLGGLCLAGCLFGRNRFALLGASFLTAFLLAVVSMCLYEQPLQRYLDLAEWCAMLGVFFAGMSVYARLFGLADSGHLSSREVGASPPLHRAA